jgi:histidine kinase/DNA gyrase B/HSP90-like ATPase
MALDFRQTWLWQHVFVNQRRDATGEEQEFFRGQFLLMRERVAHLVDQIAADVPGLTVHDITHLDSLWETASLVAEDAITLSPPEGFVFGASVLLHDAALTLAAYPNRLTDIQETVQWKDAAARWRHREQRKGGEITPPIRAILPDVLRRLHAQRAAVLAEQAWINDAREQQYLIENSDLRFFYGSTIGEIAHSHWWDVQKIDQELSADLGAFPQRTRNLVDRVKIACLLRIADALHLDQLRAPRFLRTLTRPQGHSALHWSFQEKLARPHVESDAVVFTSGHPFERADAEAWWLAYDFLAIVDRELRDVDLLLQARGRETLKARRVKGIGSPEALSKLVKTANWRPVDARILASDVPRIIENLAGKNLYGDDPLVPLRELIQNAADAVQARRRLQNRSATWGQIKVSIESNSNVDWLIVEDNGIGMSEQVLTGPLLDFGTSFWESSLAMEEFPGLAAAGMKPIGRFGIGFFSAFMLGDTVRVISRRFDRGEDTARVLEVEGGPAGRPILLPANRGEAPLDGGTRVEVRLKYDPHKEHGILWRGSYREKTYLLTRVVAALAPSLDVGLASRDSGDIRIVVRPSDWLEISNTELLSRLDFRGEKEKTTTDNLLRTLKDADGNIFGRAKISGRAPSYWGADPGWVTVSGLRANRLANVDGILAGEAITVARDLAIPIVPKEVLASWATEQAMLILNARLEDETKARAAEIVLECGGEIGRLPIVKWAGQWLNSEEFAAKISDKRELFISFEGDFDYDEDEDGMHPRDFKNFFKVSDDIILVPRFEGNIVSGKGFNWPNCLFEDRAREGRLAALVERIIETSWSRQYETYSEVVAVGTVHGDEVKREVTVVVREEASYLESTQSSPISD